MTNTRPELSLSNIDIIVLSRLCCSKPPTEAKIAETVAELAHPKAGNALELTRSTLDRLRTNGLIHIDTRALTDAGHRALQAAFKVKETPSWKDIHISHLLALALGLPVGAGKTMQAILDSEAVARTFLGVMPGIRRNDKSADKLLVELLRLSSSGLTLHRIRTELADRLIRETLGLTGLVSMTRMRAQVLARQTNGHAAAAPGSKKEMLEQVSAQLGEVCEDKSSMRRAIVRRWVYQGVHTRPVDGPRTTSPQAVLPLSNGGTRPKPIDSRPVTPASLLQTVRDTLPRVGADGRFGAEKVFISALWHRLERDRGIDLSLDRFKTWLIDANREQQIDLVRADLVGAMDPKLVAKSEIEDLGATFHFVVDRQASNRRHHAR